MLRVQGGANLQRVGASRGVASRRKWNTSEMLEKDEEGKREVCGSLNGGVFGYHPVRI